MHIFNLINLKTCILKLEIVFFMSAGNVCYGFLPPKKITEKVSAMTCIQWHSPFPPGNFE